MTKTFYAIKNQNEVSLFSIGDNSSCINMYLKFCKINSKLGFLQLVDAEKKGIKVKKLIFNLQNINLLQKWSQFKNMISFLSSYVCKPEDLIDKVIEDLSIVTEFDHSPNF